MARFGGASFDQTLLRTCNHRIYGVIYIGFNQRVAYQILLLTYKVLHGIAAEFISDIVQI